MHFHLHYWPLLLIGWFSITFAVSYIVAVEANDNPLFFPFISELGAWKPSSNAFGQLMNIGALLSAVTLYIRYRQIDSILKIHTCSLKKLWNEIEFWLGFVVALGLSIVGNFQGNIEGNRGVLVMHMIGSVMTFVIGGIYLAIQVKITFDLRPYYEKFPQFAVSRFIQYFRFISTMVFFINLISVVAFLVGIPRESNGYRIQGLLPGEAGYNFRVLSVLSEWALALIFLLNIISLTNELKAIKFQEIRFNRVEEDLDNYS